MQRSLPVRSNRPRGRRYHRVHRATRSAAGSAGNRGCARHPVSAFVPARNPVDRGYLNRDGRAIRRAACSNPGRPGFQPWRARRAPGPHATVQLNETTSFWVRSEWDVKRSSPRPATRRYGMRAHGARLPMHGWLRQGAARALSADDRIATLPRPSFAGSHHRRSFRKRSCAARSRKCRKPASR